jgi:hypothetical protein
VSAAGAVISTPQLSLPTDVQINTRIEQVGRAAPAGDRRHLVRAVLITHLLFVEREKVPRERTRERARVGRFKNERPVSNVKTPLFQK